MIVLFLSNLMVFAVTETYNDVDANTGIMLDGKVLTWDEKEYGKIILDKNSKTTWIPINAVSKLFGYTLQMVQAPKATKYIPDKSYLLVEKRSNGTRIIFQPYDTDDISRVSRVINGKIYVRINHFFPQAGYNVGWAKATTLNITGGKPSFILLNTPSYMLEGTTKKILDQLPKDYSYKITTSFDGHVSSELIIGKVKTITEDNFLSTGSKATYTELDTFMTFSVYQSVLGFGTSSEKLSDKMIVADIVESLEDYYNKDFSYVVEKYRTQDLPDYTPYTSSFYVEEVTSIFEPNEQYSTESLNKRGGLIRLYTKAEKEAQEAYSLVNNLDLIKITQDIIKKYDHQPSVNFPEDIIDLGYAVYKDIIIFGQKQVVEDRVHAGVSQAREMASVTSQLYPQYDAVKVRVSFGNGAEILSEAYIKYWSGSEDDAKAVMGYIKQIIADYKAYKLAHGSDEGFNYNYWFFNKQFTTKNGNTFFIDLDNWYDDSGIFVYIKKDFSDLMKTYYRGDDPYRGIVTYSRWVNGVNTYYPVFKWK